MKLNPYNLSKAPQDWIDWSDEVTNIINYGKTGFMIIESAPTFTGRNGEIVFQYSNNTLNRWVYINTAWVTEGFITQISNNLIQLATLIARYKSGNYTGDGNTTQSITGVGFTPKIVQLFTRTTTPQRGWYMKNDSIPTSYAHYMDNTQNIYLDDLITIDADGFTIGDATSGGVNPNVTAIIYDYICMG